MGIFSGEKKSVFTPFPSISQPVDIGLIPRERILERHLSRIATISRQG